MWVDTSGNAMKGLLYKKNLEEASVDLTASHQIPKMTTFEWTNVFQRARKGTS